jgi:cytochrome c5
VNQQDKAFMTIFSIILGVLVIIAIVVFILAGIVAGDTATYDRSEISLASVTQRLKPAGRVVETGSAEAQAEAEAQQQSQATAAQAQPAATAMTGAEVYDSGCNACHTAGVLNAPKLGDNEAWQTRYEKGMDELVSNAVNGINQMPAKGGNAALSDTNIHDAVVYILTESGIQVAAAAETAQTAAADAATEQTASEAGATEAVTETVASEEPAPTEQTAAAETAEKQPSESTDSQTTEPVAAAEASAEQPSESTDSQTTEPVAAAEASAEQPSESTDSQTEAAAGSETQTAAATAAGGQQPATSLVPADADLATGKQVYEMACFVCHAGAVPNAPKLGDTQAWESRLALGWETLNEHALKGFNAMPAKGGRADLSDEQVSAAVAYMLSEAQ